MKFKDKIWSSEGKKFHPGLISVARSNDGRIRAAQVIYLDPETGLSIAASYPEARVICSLGISNIRNIAIGNQEQVIICADNDGIDSNTTVERN
ncbi:MAG: hypothetical protein MRQ09_04870 [Candidatus Midichloria sp.]|nr:hypothetical protein [Candidatus Midichloria sp.]